MAKVFSATWRDIVRFDVKPNEDAVLVSAAGGKKPVILAVADGVTQSHYKNGRYALPHGAKEAAKIFCKTTVGHLQRSWGGVKPKKGIEESFNLANEKIRELNVKHGLVDKRMDYLQHDWFDTVGVAAVVEKNNLYYGFVGDCGLAIFNRNGKKIFQTRDMVRPAVVRFEKMYPDYDSFPVEKRTFIIRHDFRNNPDKTGYGSFTGEENVQRYYAFGAKKLNKGDLVVLYSDGFFNLLKNAEFIRLLRRSTGGKASAGQRKKEVNSFVMKMAKENPKKYGDDRTFASVVV